MNIPKDRAFTRFCLTKNNVILSRPGDFSEWTQSSTNSIGQILGPVLGTWLIAGGFYYPFIIAGATALIGMGLVYFLKRQNKEVDPVLLADLHKKP